MIALRGSRGGKQSSVFAGGGRLHSARRHSCVGAGQILSYRKRTDIRNTSVGKISTRRHIVTSSSTRVWKRVQLGIVQEKPSLEMARRYYQALWSVKL